MSARHLRLVTVNYPISPDWVEAINGWVDDMRSAGSPHSTISTRTYHLLYVAQEMRPTGPWDVTGGQLITWTAAQEWARETRRGYRNSLLSFYRWGVAKAHTTDNPALELPPVRTVPPTPRPTPDHVYKAAMLQASRRERLMFRLAAEHGLRRTEVAVSHSRDLVEDLTGWSLIVHGKGGKTRIVPLLPTVAAELHTLGDGYFFPGRMDGHLSPRHVGKLVSRLMPPGWTMHTLRHRFATKAYAIDRDLFTLQELLGHASPATTRLYVLTPDDTRRRLVHAAAGVPEPTDATAADAAA